MILCKLNMDFVNCIVITHLHTQTQKGMAKYINSGGKIKLLKMFD